MAMKTSPAGRAAITQREGCRLTAYRDTKGIPTIGVGHVDATPPKTVMGMTITQAQSDALLAADLASFEAAVNKAAPRGMPQNAFDACVSLAFNIGVSAFSNSTVARKLASGDLQDAADAFLMWVKPPELKGRRESERAQFLKPDAASGPFLVDTASPVLAGIETAMNQAAAAQSAPKPAPIIPPVVGPHLLPPPAKPGFWAWLGALFTRKAA